MLLARSARARTGAAEGAAVRDDMGRTYAAGAVDLPSLRLSALQAAVTAAVSSGARRLEAAAVVGESAVAADPDLAALADLGGCLLLLAGPDGVVREVRRRVRSGTPGPTNPRTAPASRAVQLVLLAAVLFGTTGTAQALGPETTTPLQVGAARLGVGGLLLAVVAMRTHGYRPVLALLGRPAGWVATLGVAIYQPAFFVGTQRGGVAVGTLVALGSAPLFAGALSAVVDHRPPSRTWYAGTSLALAGLVTLTMVGADVALDPFGVVASLTAGAGYAAFTVAGGRLLASGGQSLAIAGASFGAAAVLLAPFLVGATWLLTPAGAGLALWLGVVPTAVAYLVFFRGLAALEPATVTTLTLAEPLVATALGASVLDERLTPAGAAGCLLVGLGLLVLGRQRPARSAIPAQSSA